MFPPLSARYDFRRLMFCSEPSSVTGRVPIVEVFSVEMQQQTLAAALSQSSTTLMLKLKCCVSSVYSQ